MIYQFFITGNDGLYKCAARLICRITTPLGIDTSTFTYQLGFIDTPADSSYDMWPEEFAELMSSFATVDSQNWTENTDFTTTEALARATAINRLQAAIATYETWPHYSDHSYI